MGSIGNSQPKTYRTATEFRTAIESKYSLSPSVHRGQYTISQDGRDLGTIRFSKDLGYSTVLLLGKDNTGRDTWSASNTLEGLELQLRRR